MGVSENRKELLERVETGGGYRVFNRHVGKAYSKRLRDIISWLDTVERNIADLKRQVDGICRELYELED